MTAVLEQLTLEPAMTIVDPLLAALHRLDHLLEAAVARAQTAGADPAGAALDARELLGRGPGQPLFAPPAAYDASVPILGGSRLGWLAQAFGLDPFDLDLVLLALAPEVDLRYERLFGYLQDDAAVRRPTVGLALDLLCATTAERLSRRKHVTPAGALVYHRLLRVGAGGTAAAASLLAQPLTLDPQITNLLLGVDALDSRLQRVCRLRATDELSEAGDLPAALRELGVPAGLHRAATAAESFLVYLSGPPSAGKQRVSIAAAAEAGLPHLTIDIGALLAGDDDVAGVLALALRDAWFRNAVVYLRGGDLLWRDERAYRRVPLATLLDNHAGPVILGGTQPWAPGTAELSGVLAVPVDVPDGATRRRWWTSSLAREDLSVARETIDTLAGRFRLTGDQIVDAVTTAARRLRAPSAFSTSAPASTLAPTPDPAAVTAALFAAARAGRGHDLAALATRVPVRHRWDALVLPDEALAQLREICQRVIRSEHVLDTWGFRARLARGCGVTVLFSGGSGTGKTMAAEVLAGELGLDLYRVELAGVVSKYIGETEKNLDRIFAAAEHSNAILLFDEADALFGKRSEVRDARDRYANIEVSYLLQRMESYEGVAILATNLRGNLDAAFVRRLAFTVVFPFPDVESRRRIWERIWPEALPRAADLDSRMLAERFPLSGGNIRNIALGAAFLAAEAGTDVTLEHVRHATNREYQKLGKTLTSDELG